MNPAELGEEIAVEIEALETTVKRIADVTAGCRSQGANGP